MFTLSKHIELWRTESVCETEGQKHPDFKVYTHAVIFIFDSPSFPCFKGDAGQHCTRDKLNTNPLTGFIKITSTVDDPSGARVKHVTCQVGGYESAYNSSNLPPLLRCDRALAV